MIRTDNLLIIDTVIHTNINDKPDVTDIIVLVESSMIFTS